ncbi:uncharacterized protein LAESUDRAFT_649567, partial [Laetiporus sulphureus 93-53]
VDEPLFFTSPEAHFHISDSQRYSEDITSWLQSNRNDPACANFLPLLKDHILGHLRGHPYDGNERGFSHQDHHTMIFEKN